jgi:hypothetical protein
MSKKATPKDDANDEAPVERTPTPEEAKAMFEERPCLAEVLTTEGPKTRADLQ